MMDISYLTFIWCSQLTEMLDDIYIKRAATEHNFPVWNSLRSHFRPINSNECRERAISLFVSRNTVSSLQSHYISVFFKETLR